MSSFPPPTSAASAVASAGSRKLPLRISPFEGIIIRGVAWRNQAGIDKIGALLALSAL